MRYPLFIRAGVPYRITIGQMKRISSSESLYFRILVTSAGISLFSQNVEPRLRKCWEPIAPSDEFQCDVPSHLYGSYFISF